MSKVAEYFEAVNAGATIAEAKKKLKGNLCVHTGKGSGGGFTGCSVALGRRRLPGYSVTSAWKGVKKADTFLKRSAQSLLAKDKPGQFELKGTREGYRTYLKAVAAGNARKANAALKRSGQVGVGASLAKQALRVKIDRASKTPKRRARRGGMSPSGSTGRAFTFAAVPSLGLIGSLFGEQVEAGLIEGVYGGGSDD